MLHAVVVRSLLLLFEIRPGSICAERLEKKIGGISPCNLLVLVCKFLSIRTNISESHAGVYAHSISRLIFEWAYFGFPKNNSNNMEEKIPIVMHALSTWLFPNQGSTSRENKHVWYAFASCACVCGLFNVH